MRMVFSPGSEGIVFLEFVRPAYSDALYHAIDLVELPN
jgi:hypothetical protein